MKPQWPEHWPLLAVIAIGFFVLMYAAHEIAADTERAERERASESLRGN